MNNFNSTLQFNENFSKKDPSFCDLDALNIMKLNINIYFKI